MACQQNILPSRPSSKMEDLELDLLQQQLYDAAKENRFEDVRKLLRNPRIDVNWSNPRWFGVTALHIACSQGHVLVVEILLGQEDLDVNRRHHHGYTPFALGCANGNTAVVRLLLNNPRVDINLRSTAGYTALFWAAAKGHVHTIMDLIASGRDLDLGEPGNDTADAIAASKRRGKSSVAALLERFIRDPDRTRFEVRKELGDLRPLAADLFASVVFLSDDFFRLESLAVNPGPVRPQRFFAILKGLPMELQMVTCHRAMGSREHNITTKEAEMAFRRLAARLLV